MRIRVEERALGAEWAQAFEGPASFVPRVTVARAGGAAEIRRIAREDLHARAEFGDDEELASRSTR